MSGVMWSRIGYRGTRRVENSPLASISSESEEELMRYSPGSAVWLTREGFPLIPPLSMPSPASPKSKLSTPTSTPPPPPLPPKVGIASVIKLPVFDGVGNEEPGCYGLCHNLYGMPKAIHMRTSRRPPYLVHYRTTH